MNMIVATSALLAVSGAHAVASVPCTGHRCGDELVAQGWTRIAECRGHNWSYLLQKDEKVVLCTGVNGRAGPIEFPCEAFKGNLDKYRLMAAGPRRGGECVLSSAVTGKAENQQ
jgi:hypothetical protein